jgi:outer membrane protein assembly factor BamB
MTIRHLALCFTTLFTLSLSAQDTAPGRRLLVADDSTHRLAIIRPDGTFEREEKVGAIHNAQLLKNGNLVFQDKGWNHIVEKTPDGKVVWEYDSAKTNPGQRVEVHAFQRLDDGNTMIAESGVGRIIEVSPEGKIVKEVKLQVSKPNAHSDTRMVRKIANGNYLVAHEADGIAKEYAPDGKVVWEFPVPMFDKPGAGGHGPEAFGNHLFSAERLANGNTLIGTGNGHSVIEVTPDKKIVWKLEQKDLPGITLAWVCRVERLANGNTVINNCHAGPENPQLIEVTPDKKVVWQWKDFKNFGNSTPVAMILPEK